MTLAVVEAGPHTVRGPGLVPDSAAAALEFIDDPIALVGDEPVDTVELWRDVLRAASGGAGDVVVVVPTWWPGQRVDVIVAAATCLPPGTVVRHRSAVLCGTASAVLELSAEYAVLTQPDGDPVVTARGTPGMAAQLQTSHTLLIDTPEGVQILSADVAADLRRAGIPFVHSTSERMRRAAAQSVAERAPVEAGSSRRRGGGRAVAVVAGIAVTVTAAAGGWAAQTFSAVPRPQMATRTLIEGRVALQVPAEWTVERVTGDAGSARVRVAAPGGLPALHVTQSLGAATVPLAEVGESLRAALTLETDGVFVDFDAAGSRAGRPAVTYVERRTATLTRWAVIVDGPLRIAIGCQHEPGNRDSVEQICAEAVGSAHALP
ncbi:type VII secretion-associated protein [Mycolicibacterium gilvum]|uniref:Type VII secretion-associated protein n=1 Tax=Mycolicibacterium gilvum (strain DSM 45189 / LMG 24558 / Spyr1) TaxID=278137 RepID=E6TDG3_MYCSR|nr:type VII secretion-associated protein [Mycolicibacterium gilvum]ADU00932.1 hypothetical protein Mspyr1_43750 [Mycolicibacterium gilvum Spyr1]